MLTSEGQANTSSDEALRQSEERFRSILENSQVALYKRDYLADSYEYISPAILTITGYTPAEMTAMSGDEIFELVYPADREMVKNVIDQTIARGGGHCQFEYRFFHKNQQVRWVSEATNLIIGPDGNPREGVGSVQDITTRKQAEEAVIESEKRLRLIFDAAPIAIALTRQSKFMYVNPKYVEMHAYDHAAELIGRPVLEQVAAPSRNESLARSHRRSQDLPVESQYEYLGLRKDGSQFPVMAAVSRIHLADGPATVGFFQDISARRQIEEQVRALNENLEARVVERTIQFEAAIQELAATSYAISHHLRSPLRALNGYSLALLEDYGGALDDTARGYLGRIDNASKVMAGLIEGLLKILRIARSEIKPVQVDLAQIARLAAAEYETLPPSRKVTFVLPEQLIVQADPLMLQIAVTNLFDNAMKFACPGVEARIELGSLRNEGQTVLFIKDNGIGFDMAHADRLFETFQQLHDPTETEGVGIGLSIVQRIIQRHGGKIWAESAPGAGAVFYFTLSSSPG